MKSTGSIFIRLIGLIGLILSTSWFSGIAARPPPPPPPDNGPPNAPYDPCALAARLGALYDCATSLPHLAGERLIYRMSARWKFISKTGQVVTELVPGTYLGRSAYRVSREVTIFGKRSAETVLVDAEGLFPYAFTRQSQQMFGPELLETMRWDHIAGKLYVTRHEVENGRPAKQTRAQVIELGRETPADAVDPLTAMLRFRIRYLAGISKGAWRAYIFDGIGSRFEVTARENGRPAPEAASPVGKSAAAPFIWEWRSLCDDGDRRLDMAIASDRQGTPLSLSMDLWGATGRAELVSRVAITNAATTAFSEQ